MADLLASILQRVGDDIDRNNLPQILYEDEDNDKVVLASDGDLAAAVDYARRIGWKGLRLHLEYPDSGEGDTKKSGPGLDYAQKETWASAYNTIAAGAALVAGVSVLAFLKRSSS